MSISQITTEDSEVPEDVLAFYAAHRASGPNHVILVTMVTSCDCGSCEGLTTEFGVFSSFEAANEWAETFSEEFECMFTPMVIDYPDYGPRGAAN